MAGLRARLSWIVTVWLLCHGTSLAALPFALCCRDEMTALPPSAGDPAAEDCPLHAHAAPTAEHVATADAPAASAALANDGHTADVPTHAACTMRSTCTPSDQALESLLGAVAVIPADYVIAHSVVSVPLTMTASPVHPHTPLRETPPPKQ